MQNLVQLGLHFLACCSWICTTLCSWVCTTLWVCSWVGKLDSMQWGALMVCWQCTLLYYSVQLSFQFLTLLSLETLCSESPCRCAGDAHLSTNERKVQRTWSESSAGQKCKGSEQEVVSTEQHPQTKSTLASLFDDRWKVFSSEHYLLLMWREVDIVGSIFFLSLFLIVQETTQEEVVVNPTTPSDQAHPCLFLWWTTCRPSGWGWMLFAAFVFYLFSWLLVDLILLKKYVVPSTIEHCNTFMPNTTLK